MADRTDIIFNDTRSQLRIKDSRRVFWKVESGNKMGKGRIRNISTTGMLLETNGNYVPNQNSHFSFDTNLGHDNYIPQNGQLVWSRKKSLSKNKHLCGIKFIAPGEYVSGKLRQRVQRGLRSIVTNRRLRTISSGVLIVVMIGLVGYVASESGVIYQNLEKSSDVLIDTGEQQAALTQSYASRYYTTQLRLESTLEELEATKMLYAESESMLRGVRSELAVTKGVLTETEQMLGKAQADLAAIETQLASIQGGNANLNGEITEMSANIAALRAESEEKRIQLQETIAQLQVRNESLTRQMSELETQLNYLSGNIKTIDDGEALIRTYKERMKLVKKNIRGFKKEAEAVRKSALNEQDRIRLTLGNNGFLFKDGQVVQVDKTKYDNAINEAIKNTPAVEAQKPAPKVNIDVSFVE